MRNKKFLVSTIILAIALITLPLFTYAGFIPTACIEGTGEGCGLKEFLQTFANFYSMTLKYLGAIALLFFVVGGIIMINSGGNQEKVAQGRKILVGTTVGLLIVMGSYVFIKRVENLIGVKSEYQITQEVDNFCVSQPDGTVCAGEAGNVYVCYLGLCQNGTNGRDIVTSCEANYNGTCVNNCNATSCSNGTCTPDLCDGDVNVVCCIPNP